MNIEKELKIRRRAITVPTLFMIAGLLVLLSPILCISALIISTVSKYSTTVNALFFIYGYVFFECAGVFALTFSWITAANEDQLLEKTRTIQGWWSRGLLKLGTTLYQLEFFVTGAQDIEGASAILMPCHTSLADTVLPMVFFAQRRNEGLRYVLKKELLALPCLDIAGNRLPNLFVDRSGRDTERELRSLRDLLLSTPKNQSILIYPEGTRNSLAKRRSLKNKNTRMTRLLERWPNLLPPRIGGSLTLLQENLDKDAVFLAHSGFEGSATILDLINGAWFKKKIRMHFWRIPYSDIPEDKQIFLYEQWDEMQRVLARHGDD